MPTDVAAITSSWTPPPTIVGVSGTAVETESHIVMNWTISTLADVDFTYYRIYRRVQGEELWETLIDIPTKTIVQYEDNSAGQRIIYEYMITQFKGVVGDVPLESLESEIVTISLETDAWFIVMNKGTELEALELNVTGEEHSAVVQQEVFEPLASNFKRVIRGSVLGDEGSVTARFDTMDVAMAKEHLNHIRIFKGPHILKSPFGDVWFVEFDAPGYKYLPGGHLETTIGWVEIA